jgi:non-reducing end alpha-L-arabinofuranosidase
VKADATWIVKPGLANSSCVSFESANGSGDFIRHFNFQLFLEPSDGSAQFALDATFCPRAGNSGSNAWDAASLWQDDTTWAVAAPWA